MQRTWTILRDTREKKGLLFPEHLVLLNPHVLPHKDASITVRLQVRDTALATGDYALEDHLSSTLIERKGSLMEVAQNCLSHDRARFVACLQRLRASCRFPILMLEGNPTALFTPVRGLPDPGICISALHRLLRSYSIECLLLPSSTLEQRRAMGEWVARLLIEGALCPPASPLQSCGSPSLGEPSSSPAAPSPLDPKASPIDSPCPPNRPRS